MSLIVSISYKRFIFYLLCIAILLFPINYPVFFSFRPTDIIILSVILITLPVVSIPKDLLLFFLLFFSILLISSWIGLCYYQKFNVYHLIFFYKYFIVFYIPFVICCLRFNDYELNTFVLLLFYTFFFLVFWTYIYLYLYKAGIIHGRSRPCFPLTLGRYSTDAHLYSSYLSVGLVAFVCVGKKFFKNNFFRGLLIIISMGSIFLTGSRTGVVVLVSGLFISLCFAKSIRKILKILSVSILFFLFVYIFLEKFVLTSNHSFKIVERCFMNPFNDDSGLGRIVKLIIAIRESDYCFNLLGSGILSSQQTWYDGFFSIMIAHGGFCGVFVFLSWISFIVVKYKIISEQNLRIGEYRYLLIVLAVYAVSNIITEYFLVTRSYFPFAVFISVLMTKIRSPIKEIERTL